jgi:hypothetical protein
MIWVGQEDANGCGPAALAMIAGVTYAEAKDILEACPVSHHKGNWAKEGVGHVSLDWALQRCGFWRQRTYRAWQRDNWPPRPWAPVHLCQIEQPSHNNHFVVMDGKGVVLDPLRADASLTLRRYPDVLNVCGLYRPLDLDTWCQS